jgi:hypothetical protein
MKDDKHVQQVHPICYIRLKELSRTRCSTKKNSMSTYIEFNRIFKSNSLDYVPMMLFLRKLAKRIPEKYDLDLKFDLFMNQMD